MQEGKGKAFDRMSNSSLNVIDSGSKWPRAIVLGTWVLFAFSIAMLGWHDARVGHQIIVAVGLVGLASAAIWFARGGRWIYACLLTSISLVVGYLIWWIADIADFYTVSPQLGLLSAVQLKVQLWLGLLQKRVADGFPVSGLSEFYWLVGMPLVQLVVVVMTARSLRQSVSTTGPRVPNSSGR